MDKATYFTATGPIDYNMTNDYMFRIILQENETVLRGLICSLLRLQQNELRSVEVANPIILGDNIDNKGFVLDVNVILNDNTIMNLEMQMENENNWTDRALNYTFRNFTRIQKGQDYNETKPVIHIGFLNYALFPEYPEFYAKYKILNIKSHYLFSSKVMIGVVNLNQTEIATEEDKQYDLHKWVALFKSKTWEELRMIANEKPELLEAGKSLYEYNHEEAIRWQCWAREDYRRNMNTIRKNEADLKARIADHEATLAEQEVTIAEKEATIAEKEATIAKQETIIAELQKQIENLKKQ